MDIPAHMLDASYRHANSSSPTHLRSSRSKVSLMSTNSRFPTSPYLQAQSSAEDVSTTSRSEPDNDYQTDFTTVSNPGSLDMQPDDVEDFREREYPQLKGKTYLDHGGTTVCIAAAAPA